MTTITCRGERNRPSRRPLASTNVRSTSSRARYRTVNVARTDVNASLSSRRPRRRSPTTAPAATTTARATRSGAGTNVGTIQSARELRPRPRYESPKGWKARCPPPGPAHASQAAGGAMVTMAKMAASRRRPDRTSSTTPASTTATPT
jgi:hypothetical protein